MTETDRILQRGQLRRSWNPAAARTARERAGLTQGEIARLLELDVSTISKYESGLRRPAVAVLHRYQQLIRRIQQVSA